MGEGIVSVFALIAVTVASSALAVAGAGGSLRVILYLLERNQAAPVAQSSPKFDAAPQLQETTSVAA